MKGFRILLLVICVVGLISAKDPEVYEIVDESPPNRVARQNDIKIYYSPPVFHYSDAIQQDLRNKRYASQQEINVKNFLKRKLRQRNLTPIEASYWKVVDPKLVHKVEITATKHQGLNDSTIDYIWEKLSQISNARRKARQIRTVHSNNIDRNGSIKEENSKEESDMKQEENKRSLEALSALLGQTPQSQLDGLQKLLNVPNYIYLPPLNNRFRAREEIPVKERMLDIPNPNMENRLIKKDEKDNVLQTLQAQLDAAAQAQTEQLLAEAQQQALAHVQAQEQAIENAKIQAQQAVLAQIKQQNAVLLQQESPQYHHQQQQQQHYSHPLMVPLRAEVVPQQQHEILPQPQASVYQTVPPKKTEIIYENYAPHHQDVDIREAENAILAEAKEAAEKSKLLETPDLEKVSITKTHSYTKGKYTSPGIYQKVVLEAEREKSLPYKEKNNDEADAEEEHQYASRYAFGYRIKDFKMGNDFGHEEKREGKSAHGHYHVLLPDGRIQKVEYYADPTGYHAKVTYENVAHHH